MLQGPNPLWLLLEIIYFRMGIHQKKNMIWTLSKMWERATTFNPPKEYGACWDRGLGTWTRAWGLTKIDDKRGESPVLKEVSFTFYNCKATILRIHSF